MQTKGASKRKRGDLLNLAYRLLTQAGLYIHRIYLALLFDIFVFVNWRLPALDEFCGVNFLLTSSHISTGGPGPPLCGTPLCTLSTFDFPSEPRWTIASENFLSFVFDLNRIWKFLREPGCSLTILVVVQYTILFIVPQMILISLANTIETCSEYVSFLIRIKSLMSRVSSETTDGICEEAAESEICIRMC